MKAAVISQQGTPVSPNIKFIDWPDPTTKAGEVIVKTEASALNHLDLWLGRGLPGLDFDYPRITGCDGCGIVESVGQGVDESWIGKRVILNAAVPQEEPTLAGITPAPADIRMIGEHDPGTLAEKFAAPVNNVVAVGDVDPIEAAAFGLTHLTAWRMLVSRAKLQCGQTILITGIGGGVALAALNIAKHFGCTTIVTSRHQSKLDQAAKLGATHGVYDIGEDWSRDVRSLTAKQGVNICVDSIGKSIHMSCIKSLARGGVFVTCGCTTGPGATTDLARMFWNQCSIIGSTMGDMDEFRQVVSLFVSGAIKPVVDSVHDAADAEKAFARLESEEQFGKVVIRWS